MRHIVACLVLAIIFSMAPLNVLAATCTECSQVKQGGCLCVTNCGPGLCASCCLAQRIRSIVDYDSLWFWQRWFSDSPMQIFQNYGTCQSQCACGAGCFASIGREYGKRSLAVSSPTSGTVEFTRVETIDGESLYLGRMLYGDCARRAWILKSVPLTEDDVGWLSKTMQNW